MNQAFILLFAEQPEKDILNNLLVHLQPLVPGAKEAPKMVTRGKSSKEMKDCIGDIQDKLVNRLKKIKEVEAEASLTLFEEEPAAAGAGHGVVRKARAPVAPSFSALDYAEGRARYSGVMARLKTQVDNCLGTTPSKIGSQKTFLEKGWNALCFLTRPKALRTYHEGLYDVHASRGAHGFLEDLYARIKDKDEDYSGWALQTVSYLAEREAVDSDFATPWLEKRMASIATQLRRTERVTEKLTPTFASFSHDALEDSLFEALSLRVLQKQVRERASTIAEEDTQFDAYLIEIFNRHQASTNKKEREFCLQIARGLMALGANPLVWMAHQTQDGIVGPERADAYFSAAAQTALILSHLQYRASQIGGCDAFFGAQLEALFVAFNNFADKLAKCVADGDRFLWKTAARLFNCDGAKYHRATLLWQGLRYIYMIINDNLFAFEDEDDPDVIARSAREKSIAFARACTELDAAMRAHMDAASKHSRMFNTGIVTATDFSRAVTEIDKKVAMDFAAQRQLLCSAKIAREAKEKTKGVEKEKVVLEQRTVVLGQEREAFAQKADAAEGGHLQAISEYLIEKFSVRDKILNKL